MIIKFTLDGNEYELNRPANLRVSALIDELRPRHRLITTCRRGLCGHCFILADGQCLASCILPAYAVKGKNIISEPAEGPVKDELTSLCDKLGNFCPRCKPAYLLLLYKLVNETQRNRDDADEVAEELNQVNCRCGAIPGADRDLVKELTRVRRFFYGA